MTQKQFNQQHPTGEQLTMIHYDFETTERTAQPAIIAGTKADPKYPDDPATFGMLSNIDNL